MSLTNIARRPPVSSGKGRFLFEKIKFQRSTSGISTVGYLDVKGMVG
jgi:hypothetical protein